MNQEELDHILQQHRLWLGSDGEKGKRADLWAADLRHADLRGADLRSTYLQGADLWDAVLRDADLRGADLQCANLWGADLRDADLQGVDLRCANLQGAELDTNIRNCRSFYKAKFTSNALPWLILHPRWAKFKGTVQILPS